MASSEAVASIKSYLKDILGSDSSVFSDDILESYIRKFSGRVDAVQCALESLIEEYYSSGSNDPMRRGGPSFVPESLPSSLEFFKLPFFKKVCTLYSMLTKILHCNVLDTVTKRDTIIFIWLILYCTLLNLEHSKPVALLPWFEVSWHLKAKQISLGLRKSFRERRHSTEDHPRSIQADKLCQAASLAPRRGVEWGQLRPGSCSCVRCCDHLVFRHKIHSCLHISHHVTWRWCITSSLSLLPFLDWRHLVTGSLVWWLVSVSPLRLWPNWPLYATCESPEWARSPGGHPGDMAGQEQGGQGGWMPRMGLGTTLTQVMRKIFLIFSSRSSEHSFCSLGGPPKISPRP